MSASCSFRITRTAEDLAQTLTAISQRLVKLEQRLEALELQSTNPEVNQTDEEKVMLDGVDQMLQECKGLLNTSSNDQTNDELWVEDGGDQQGMAA